MGNADVVVFQVRRGRAAAGVSRDVTDYVFAHGIPHYNVVDGSDIGAAMTAIFAHRSDGSVLFIDRADEAVIPAYRAVVDRLGMTVEAFAVAAQPRKRLPLVSVGSEQDDAALVHG
jgi:hypothetical protein